MFYTFEGVTPIGFVGGASVYLEDPSSRFVTSPSVSLFNLSVILILSQDGVSATGSGSATLFSSFETYVGFSNSPCATFPDHSWAYCLS